MKKLIALICTAVAAVSIATLPIQTFAATEKLYGDANNSGNINISDASWIQRYSAALIKDSDVAVELADVDGNGAVNILDATYIQLYIAGKITRFPVEKVEEEATQPTTTQTTTVQPTTQRATDSDGYYEEIIKP